MRLFYTYPLLQELEEDPELRARVALYKDPSAALAARRREQPPAGMVEGEEGEEEEGDDDVPEVPLEELLDDLAALELGGARVERVGRGGGAAAWARAVDPGANTAPLLAAALCADGEEEEEADGDGGSDMMD